VGCSKHCSSFNERLDLPVLLTKLDGTQEVVLLCLLNTVKNPSSCQRGEKMETWMYFTRKDGARILGMGDIVSLVEKAQEQYDAVEAVAGKRFVKINLILKILNPVAAN
jgi:signal recognition particle subunit SRP54